MRSLSADNGISRRTALTCLGASALGLEFMNSSLFTPETKDEALRLRLRKFNERTRVLLSQVLEDPSSAAGFLSAQSKPLRKARIAASTT
jgi:hypothetical protein